MSATSLDIEKLINGYFKWLRDSTSSKTVDGT